MKLHALCHRLAAALVLIPSLAARCADAQQEVPLYGVQEVVFEGPTCAPTDSPARDVELVTQWRHESGEATCTIHGFWDGDGSGALTGKIFKVRFCPTQTGAWTVVKTSSNEPALAGQNEGYAVTCIDSSRHGFWIVDTQGTGGRWFQRSDGSHPYIFGNTMYSFLSERDDKGPTGSSIAQDIRANARYFKKVRFSIMGDRYAHPEAKPFLDDSGRPTDDGNVSHRPNPAWFHHRVDLAVQIASEHDLVADLILCGPDTTDSRSVLKAGHNDGDPAPILKYIAARYGSFPNVWICLCNEFDIKDPKYTAEEIARFGRTLRRFLPYPTPLSVHASARDWHAELKTTPSWNSHVIIQQKIKKLPIATDWIRRNHLIGDNIPVIDDELAYEGAGDGWSEEDVIESHLGAFLGGGYGTTGHKPANKKGHYFWGAFDASEHLAADNLAWLRQTIDENIPFWRMAPVDDPNARDDVIGIFSNAHRDSRALEWPQRGYVLGTNHARSAIRVSLPDGKWQVTRHDAIRKETRLLIADASSQYTFDAPESRAVLFHFAKVDREPDRVVKVAVLQAGTEHDRNGNPGCEVNFNLLAGLAREAAKARPDLIVFPEYAVSGWPYPPEQIINGLAEQIPGDGVWYSRYEALAAETHAALLGWLVEKEADRLYNCSFLVAPDGRFIAKYRKVHANLGEQTWWGWSQGASLKPIEYDGVKYGISLCSDMWFPETVRCEELLGANVILHQSIADDMGHIVPTRAFDSGIPIVMTIFRGGSYAVDAQGKLLSKLPAKTPGWTVFSLQPFKPQLDHKYGGLWNPKLGRQNVRNVGAYGMLVDPNTRPPWTRVFLDDEGRPQTREQLLKRFNGRYDRNDPDAD